MNRRNWLTVAGSSAAMCALAAQNAFAQLGTRQRGQRTGQGQGQVRRTLAKHPNSYFYKDGVYSDEAARAAYRELFRFHNYAIGEKVLASKDFWTLEFGLGDFTNVGMAGIFFVNDKEHGYFGHDIYLLPGQMIAEHYHIAAEDRPAKHETWHVRNGEIWTFAQGGTKADIPEGVTLPASQDGSITCFKGKKLEVGDIDVLAKLEEPHFMIAGPRGAIVTEYASFHAGTGLRFTNPKAKA